MKKYFQIFFISFLVLCCKNESDADASNNVSQEITDSIALPKLPEIKGPPAEVVAKTANWDAFKKFDASIQRLYSNGDVLTEVEAIIESEKELSESTFPKEFNIPAVKSRIMVINTFLEQLEASAKEGASDREVHAIKQRVIEVYNSFLKQLSEAMDKNLAEDFLKNEQDTIPE